MWAVIKYKTSLQRKYNICQDKKEYYDLKIRCIRSCKSNIYIYIYIINKLCNFKISFCLTLTKYKYNNIIFFSLTCAINANQR